jgi:squalene-hopene/tetraprenyl-beta-curcumene cyclase
VVIALRELRHRGYTMAGDFDRAAERWLVRAQNSDGSWGAFRGCRPSIEETALALEALAGTLHVAATERGKAWLVERVEEGSFATPAPIGFYFAKLWYYESLYPLIFATSALGGLSALERLALEPALAADPAG